MNIFKEKGFQAILLIVVLILLFNLYTDWTINSELEKKSVVTIGEIEKIHYFDNGEPRAELVFVFKGKKNKAGAYLGSDIKKSNKIGNRLFIQFSPKDPTVFKVLEDPKVPKALVAPENGWDSIPIGSGLN